MVPLLIELDADEALSKALNTCSEDLALLVLLCKFAESSDAFYRFLAARAAIPGGAAPLDLWHAFALSHDMPMPNVKAVRRGGGQGIGGWDRVPSGGLLA